METVGRVFAAVPLPSEVALALADRTGHIAIPGRVVPPGNWHVTLRFLGSVDRVTYERFLAGLTGVSGLGSFAIRLSGLGAFPNARRATVLWVGIEEGARELVRLNSIAEAAAGDAGLGLEERPYHPHLTLARIRPAADVSDLLEEQIHLRWKCDSVVVFRSHSGRGGVRYEPLETFSLTG